MMIASFMGERVDQMARADLEPEARREIERLQRELAGRSIEHVVDLAAQARRR